MVSRWYPGTIYIIALVAVIIYMFLDTVKTSKLLLAIKPDLLKNIEKIKEKSREGSVYDWMTFRQRDFWIRQSIL